MSAVEERIRTLIAASPYLGWLELRVEPAGDGFDFVLPSDEKFVSHAARGLLHGGVIAAFMEAAGALALRAEGGTTRVRAIDFTSAFLREGTRQETRARVHVVRRGRRFATLRVDAWQSDASKLIANGHGSFALD